MVRYCSPSPVGLNRPSVGGSPCNLHCVGGERGGVCMRDKRCDVLGSLFRSLFRDDLQAATVTCILPPFP